MRVQYKVFEEAWQIQLQVIIYYRVIATIDKIRTDVSI